MGIGANNSDAHFYFMGNDIYSKKIQTRLEFAHEIIKSCLKGGYKYKQQNLNQCDVKNYKTRNPGVK